MEVFPSLHSIYVRTVSSQHLLPCFPKMVETGLWAVWAEQHAPNTQSLPRPARKELNCTKAKEQPRSYCLIYILYLPPALKFIYFEKATKFCKISTLLLSVCTVVKSKVEISQNFVAFSKYMNFKDLLLSSDFEIIVGSYKK